MKTSTRYVRHGSTRSFGRGSPRTNQIIKGDQRARRYVLTERMAACQAESNWCVGRSRALFFVRHILKEEGPNAVVGLIVM